MAEAHLDRPGEVTWFPNKGPAPVLGPCPHTECPHDMGGCVAWGPDYEHYVLDECSVPAERGGCDRACRSWTSEIPQPNGGVRYAFAPFLHIKLGAK